MTDAAESRETAEPAADPAAALKQAVEELSEQEDVELELRDRIRDLVQAHDVDAVNQLPFLYRMEIKRVLEEDNNHYLARQIDV